MTGRGGGGSLTTHLQEIEAAAQGRTRIAASIAQESVPNCFDGDAVLQSQAAHDRRVLGGRIGVASSLSITEKDLGKVSVGVARDGRDVGEPVALEGECLGRTAIGKTVARGHDALRGRDCGGSRSLDGVAAPTSWGYTLLILAKNLCRVASSIKPTRWHAWS